MVKAVVFDLDDTLIAEIEYIKSGYHHIAGIIEENSGFEKNQVFDDLMNLFRLSQHKVFNRLYDQYHIGYSKEMIEELVNEYRGHFPDIRFYDDVLPCLMKLKSLGIKIGVITDGNAIAQRLKLQAVHGEEYFDEIIVTDELGRDYWKPHPRAFELMKERLKVNFDEMIYVGDNPEKDFAAGNILGIRTIEILRGNGVYAIEHSDIVYRAMYKIEKLQELDSIIRVKSG